MKKFIEIIRDSKRFIFMMIAMFTLAIGAVNAQVITKNGSFGDNWFVGVNVGTIAPLAHSFDWGQCGATVYRGEFGVEGGKWITPVIGLGATYEAQINTTGAKTALDCGTLMADVHVNLTNLFWGYTGEPRAWEVEVIPSVGYIHFYGGVAPIGGHSTFAETRVAVSANYNFGQYKEWTVYVRPGVQYTDRIRDINGQFDLRAGLIYKFKGTKSKSHNFVKCPYSVTQADYDAALAEINALKNAPAKLVRQEVEVIKEVQVAVPAQTYVVNFAQGKSVLTDDSKEVLNTVAGEATVVASASPEGGKTFNKKLSEKRAAAVKEYLEGRGVKVVSAEGVGVTGKNSNRIAVVTTK